MDMHPLVGLARLEPVAVGAVMVGAFILFLLAMRPPGRGLRPSGQG